MNDMQSITIATANDNDTFILTKFACLESVLNEYGVPTEGIVTPRIGEHIVDDLLELLAKCGYLRNTKGIRLIDKDSTINALGILGMKTTPDGAVVIDQAIEVVSSMKEE